MFGIGGWEFIFIAILALLLFGPDKLPQAARSLGRFMRDFKRYQDLMESTIRGEIFAADPTIQKDQFEKGKEFREKVAGGGFSKAKPAESGEEPEASEPEDVEPEAAEPAAEPEAAGPGAADASPDAGSEGEGERDEA